MRNRMLVVMGFVLIAGCALAYAQTGYIDIGFPFVAGGKDLPAGKYMVKVDAEDINSIAIEGPKGGAILLGITRLGMRCNHSGIVMVFDEIKGQDLLSEIWFPNRDGYLVLASKEPHTHKIVDGSNQKM